MIVLSAAQVLHQSSAGTDTRAAAKKAPASSVDVLPWAESTGRAGTVADVKNYEVKSDRETGSENAFEFVLVGLCVCVCVCVCARACVRECVCMFVWCLSVCASGYKRQG
jgi:hypothetical protein